MDIARFPCSHLVSASFLRKSYVRSAYGFRAETVRFFLATFPPTIRSLLHDHRTVSDMSTGYGLTIFKSLYNFLFYKIVESTEPVKSYDNSTAVATAVRRPYDNGLTGSLRAP